MISRDAVLDLMHKDIGKVRRSGDWFTVSQELIDGFVAITGDTNWIHTDSARASKEPNFGVTVAPGAMGIALLPRLTGLDSAYTRYPCKYALNQGWDRIRFLRPLRVGSRIRAVSKLVAAELRPDGSLRVAVEFCLEVENSAEPWMIGIKIGRFFYD